MIYVSRKEEIYFYNMLGIICEYQLNTVHLLKKLWGLRLHCITPFLLASCNRITGITATNTCRGQILITLEFRYECRVSSLLLDGR